MSLQILLEKLAGVCLVEKLRHIQLYEAGFNLFQQFMFGQEAMRSLTDQGLLPEEYFSKKGSTADDAKFDKTLVGDLSRQSRIHVSIVSVDAAQCYDRVNHVIMSLVWLALIGVVGPIKVLLHCLQIMRFFKGQDMVTQALSQEEKDTTSWNYLHRTREQRCPTLVNMLELSDSQHTQEAETWCTHLRPNDWDTNPLSRCRCHVRGQLRLVMLG